MNREQIKVMVRNYLLQLTFYEYRTFKVYYQTKSEMTTLNFYYKIEALCDSNGVVKDTLDDIVAELIQ